jgi:fibronectin-binding autotransporter adhesin
MQDISETLGNNAPRNVRILALAAFSLFCLLTNSLSAEAQSAPSAGASRPFAGFVRAMAAHEFAPEHVASLLTALAHTLPLHMVEMGSLTKDAVESVPTDLSSGITIADTLPEISLVDTHVASPFALIPEVTMPSFSFALGAPTEDDLSLSGTKARTIGVAGAGITLIGSIVPSEYVPHMFTQAIASIANLSAFGSSLSGTIPRLAQFALLPMKNTQFLLANNDDVPAKGLVLGASTTADALALANKKATLPFLDRLSLSLYCALSAKATVADRLRCDYDAQASGSVASLAQGALTPTFGGNAIATTAPAVSSPTNTSVAASQPQIVSVPTYITRYVTQYIEGLPGAAGKDGKDGRDGVASINNVSIPSGFGSYAIPSIVSPSTSIGISTIGYLKDTTIDSPTINAGTANNFLLTSPTLKDAVFNGLSLFNGPVVLGGTTLANNFTATTSTLLNTTLTNSTTTNAYVANLFVDAATSTDSYVTRLIAASSTLTDAVLTNSTTTNAYIANLVAASSTLVDVIATNATSTNLFATNAAFTNSTTTNAFIQNLTIGSQSAGNALFVNATTTNLFATSSVFINTYTDSLTVGSSTSASGNLTLNGGLTVNGTSSLATTTFADFTGANGTTTSFFSTLLSAVTGLFTNLTATNATLTNSTTTNAYVSNLSVGTSTANSMVLTGTLNVGGTTTLATTSATDLVATNATTTSFFSTLLSAVTGLFTSLTATNATTTNLFTTNLAVGNASTTGNQTIDGTLTVNGTTTLGSNTLIQGSVTLGTSTSNNITVNGLINSDIVPAANKTYDVGSPSFYWKNAYVDNLTVNTISGTALDFNNTNSSTFTINNDNNTNDAEDASFVFFRGLVTPNAVLRWNSTTKRIESNMSFKVEDETPSTGSTTLTVQGGAGQGTRNLFQLLTNGGATTTVFNANGWLGIGSTTPGSALTVVGNGYFGGNVTATGTLAVTGTTTLATAGGRVGIGTSTPQATLHVFGTDGIIIPVGTTAQRSSSTLAGIIRYNTTNTTFEGFNGTTWGSLGGVIDTNLDTYVSAENTPGANNDQLKFVTLGNLRAIVDSNGNFGIGTSTPGSLLSVQGNAYIGGNVTATGTLNVAGQTTLATASSTGLTATNLYSTNASTTNGTVASLWSTLANLVAANVTNLVATNATTTNASTTNGTITNLYFTNASGTAATIPTLYGTTGSFATLVGTNASTTNLTVSNNAYFGGNTGIWNGSGNLGVGTTTPTSLLTVASSTATGTASLLSVGTTTSLLTVLANGNVGIGTTTPDAFLSVSAYNYGETLLKLGATSGGATGIDIRPLGAFGDVFTGINVVANVNGIVSTVSHAVGVGVLGTASGATAIGVKGNNTSGGAGIYGLSSGSGGYGVQANGTTGADPFVAQATGVNKFIIKNSGNVGVGTDTPTSLLSVASSTATGASSLLSVGTSTTLFQVLANGNVGIGTSNPATALDILGASQTGSSATGTLNLAQTWNTSGSPIALKMSITDTASGAASQFLSFLGGSSASTEMFAVNKDGSINVVASTGVNQIRLNNATNGYTYIGGNNSHLFVGGGTANTTLFADWSDNRTNRNGVEIPNTHDYRWSSTVGATGDPDLGLQRVSAGMVGVNNGTANTWADLLVRNLTLGTTSTSTLLTIQGTSTKDLFDVASTTGASLFHITSNGNVGIGTSNPTAALQIVSGNPGSPYSGVSLLSGLSNAYTAFTVGRQNPEGYFGIAGGANHYINGSVAGDTVILATAGKLLLGTGTVNPAGTMALAISGANVGIGTSTPTSLLTIASSTATGNSSLLSVGTSTTLFNVLANNTVNIGQFLSVDATGAITNSQIDSSKFLIKDGNGGNYIKSDTGGARFKALGIGTDPNLSNAITEIYSINSSAISYGVISNATNICSSGCTNAGVGGFYTSRTLNAAQAFANAYGVNVDTLTLSGGATVTNNYGVYIANGTAGTNHYGLYQNDAANNNYFAGNLGIGTTTPGSLLSVQASSTAQTSPFIAFNSTTSPIFNVLANGNVGIGTSTPSGILSIVTPNYGSTLLKISAASGGATGIDLGSTGVSGDLNKGINIAASSFGITASVTSPTGIGITGTGAAAGAIGVQGNTTSGGTGVYGLSDGSGGFGLKANGTNSADPFVAQATGVNKFIIKNSGNVGVGTDTPTSLLSIASSTATGNSSLLSVGTSTTLFQVLANGNVGIGTSSPIGALTIQSPAVGTSTLVLREITSQTADMMQVFDTSGTKVFALRNDGAILAGSGPTAAFSGVSATGYYIGGSQFVENLNSPVTGITIHGRDGSSLNGGDFYLRAGSSGTGVAGSKLTFTGGLAAGTDIAGGNILINGGTGTGTGTPGSIIFSTTNALGVSSSTIQTLTEKMRIDSTGNVGIGSTTPGSLLSVQGNAYIGGNVTATGTLDVTSTTTLRSNIVLGTSPVISGTTDIRFIVGSAGSSYRTAIEGIGTATNFTAYNNNVRVAQMDYTGFTLDAGSPLRWSSSTGITNGIYDLGINRNAAGVLEVNNGTAGVLADLKARNVTATGTLNVTGQSTFTTASSTAETIATLYSSNILLGTTTNTFDSSKLTVQGTTTLVGTSVSPTALRVIGNFDNTATSTFVPKSVSALSIGSGVHSVAVSGNYVYDVNQTLNRLSVIDVSTPSSPTIVSTTTTTGGPQVIVVAGKYAYTVNSSSSTLSVFDVSTPSSPTLVSTSAAGSAPGALAVSGRYAYVASSNTNKLVIMNISNPAAPVTLSTVTVGSLPVSVAVVGSYAYVTNGNDDTMTIVNIANPSSPVVASTTATGAAGSQPRQVVVSGRYAYVVNSNSNTVAIIDVSNPKVPVLVASPSTGATGSTGLAIAGRYLYITSTANIKVSVMDVANPSAPVLVSVVAANDSPSPAPIAVSGRYVYVGNTTTLQTFDTGGVESTAALIHSLEAGNLSVRNDIVTQGNVSIGSGLTIGSGGLFSNSSGAFSVATTSSLAAIPALAATLRDNSTNTTLDVLSISRGSSGTALGNIGAGIAFNLQNASGTFATSSRISSILTNVVNGAEGSALTFFTRTGGAALAERLRITQEGYLFVGTTTSVGSSTLLVQGVGSINPFVVASSTGVSLLTLAQNGAFGIGSSTPGALLSVNGDSYFAGNVTATGTLSVSGTTTLATASGLVGIGTSNPGGKLEVNGSGLDTTVLFRSGASNKYTYLSLGRTGDDFELGVSPSSGAFFNASGAFGGAFDALAGDGILKIPTAGTNRILLGVGAGGATLVVDQPSTGIKVNGNTVIFGTSTLATTTATLFTATGQTTLATASSTGLTVTGNTFITGSTTTVRNLIPETTLTYALGASSTRWNEAWINTLNLGSSTWSLSQGSDGRLSIFDHPLSNGAERFTVSSNGNVGIGSSTPGSMLSVVGASYFGGNITATGTLAVTGNTALGNASTTALTVTGPFFATGTSTLATTTATAFTGASINATALLASNGLLSITGTSTLATTTATALTVSGQTTLANASSTNLGVSGNAYFAGSGIWNSAGNLGIGTTTPGTKLQVIGTDSFTNPFVAIGATSSNYLGFGNTAGGNMAWIEATGTGATNLIFRSKGNVGVASSTGAVYPGAKFSIAGGVGIGSAYYTSTVADGNLIVSGNVGIGTSTPASLLQVAGTSTLGVASTTSGILSFLNSTNGFSTSLRASTTLTANLMFTLPGTNGTANDVLTSDGSGGMYWKAGGSLSGGQTGFIPRFLSATTVGTSTLMDNGVVAGVNATSSTVAFNVRGVSGSANTIFNVASSSNASFFAVLPNGNVGIGTTTPGSLVELYGTGQTTANLTDAGVRTGNLAINDTGTVGGSGGAITFGNLQSNATTSIGWAAIKAILTNGSNRTTGDLAFSTRNATTDTSLTERMRITAGGNIGIGTSSPAYKLQIAPTFTANADDGLSFAPTGTQLKSRIGLRSDASGNYRTALTLTTTGGADTEVLSMPMNSTNIGDVGIGTIAPRGVLHVVETVNGASAGGYSYIQGPGQSGGTLFTTTDTIPMVNGNGLTGAGGLGLIPSRWGNASTVDDHNALNIAGSQRNVGAISSTLAFSNWGYFTGTTTAAGGLGNATAQIDAVKFRFQLVDAGSAFSQRLDLLSRSASTIDFPALSVLSNGNVGIGTQTPGSNLQVNGTTTLATGAGVVSIGSSNTNPGQRLAVYAPTTDGLWLNPLTGASSTALLNNSTAGAWNPLVKSGDSFLLFKGTAADSADSPGLTIASWSNSSSGLRIDNTGRVTINGANQTTTALTDAGVAGGELHLNDTSGAAGNGGVLSFGASSSGKRFAAIKGYFENGTGNTQGDIAFSTRAATSDTALTERMRILYNGNVGIGNPNPQQKLDILGTSVGNSSSQTNLSAFTGGGIRLTGSVSGASQDAITYQSGGSGAAAAIAFGRGTSWDTFVSFYTNAVGNAGFGNTTERARIDSNGNLGVGTTTPGYRLDVAGGAINVATGQSYKYNGADVITASTTLANYFFGGAGNLTMTGGVNAAFGLSALGSNTSGVNNMAMGQTALYGNQTGFNNVGIGVDAGRYLADGTTLNTNSNTSVFIGSGTKALAASDNNEVVIGNAATGFGSNTIAIGTTGTTKTVLYGSLGIGTSTPAVALQVIGDIRVGTAGPNNGCVQGFGGTSVAGVCSSDQRLKTDITDISSVLQRFTDLRVINYRWNQTAGALYNDDMTSMQTGYLAQNVEALFPELVVTNKEGYKQVNYSAMSLYTAEAVKELAVQTKTENQAVTMFPADEAVDYGTIVAFSTSTHAYTDTTSSSTYSMVGIRKAVNGDEAVGIVTTKSLASTSGTSTVSGVPVAFSGKMVVHLASDSEAVKAGEYLTVSTTTPGAAVKMNAGGRSVGMALSSGVAGGDVLVLVQLGYQNVDTASRSATTTAMLTTGNLDLNANGVAIVNIKSLASANGSWSIDENGRIVAKVLCLEDVCIDKTQLTNILNSTGQSGMVAGTSTTSSDTGTTTATSTDSTATGTSTPTGTTGTTTPSDTSTSTSTTPTDTPTGPVADTSASSTTP